MKYTKEEKCLLWLDSFSKLEYKHKSYLFKAISISNEIKSEIKNQKDYITANMGDGEYNTIYNSANQVYFDFVLDNLERRGIKAITILSKDYPEDLKSTEIPPLVLYAKGDISLLKQEKLAIVGSRRSLPLSIGIAKNYAKGLSEAGYTLVTGIAEGVDSAVLESTLNAKGKVISVIASGFDNLYPKSNQSLLDKVVENGLALSEHPPEVKSQPYFFPVRNRIIAGLSKGVIIISAGKRSGTFYTAEYAEEYGKDVFAVPYNVGIESGAGCNELIKRGAILTDDYTDVLDFYGVEKQEKKVALTTEESAIVECLKDGEMHVEKICDKLSKKIFEITPQLSILEIKGVVIKSGNNKYSLIR